MKNISLIFLFASLTVISGCLTQDDLTDDTETGIYSSDNPVNKELNEISEILRNIDKEDDIYGEKSEEARILKVAEKKFKLVKMLDEDEKYKDYWNTSYQGNFQKPKYLKISGDSYLTFDGGQCVDAVYCLTNHKVSIKQWIKGEKVVDAANIEPGTIIATFNENGQYYGHAAVFKAKSDGVIEVYDQNWWTTERDGKIVEWSKNIFGTHIIIGKNGVLNPNNINNYHIVMVK